MKNGKVLVVTGYYNREWCVKESIQSLINQTYEKIEIIAFDDCSSDNTFEELHKINSDKYRAIKLEKNMGFVAGLIFIIEKYATNFEYITIHGSGDIAHPKLIEEEILALERNPNLAVSSCYFKNEDPKTGEGGVKILPEIITKDILLKDSPISHGGTTIRKSFYDLVGGYNPIFKYCQDYELWLRISKVGQIGVVQKCLYKRISQIDGASVKTNRFIEQCQYKILALHINDPDKLAHSKNLSLDDIMVSDFISTKNNKEIQRKIFRHFHVLLFRDYEIDQLIIYKNSNMILRSYFKFMLIMNKIPFFVPSIKGLYNVLNNNKSKNNFGN